MGVRGRNLQLGKSRELLMEDNDLGELPTFKNLTELDVSSSTFSNKSLQMLGSMTSLETLYLDDCNLPSTLLEQELPSFKNLIELTIRNTVFHNNFLQMIGAMTSLQSIGIYGSNLNDTLFDQELPTFKNLTEVG
ncbi:uncharacterized protein LOC116139276 [Pistacia vera]|uniref:uncharacterized protein LOC116139276 n=1 Tax=Pistacia vera TaxID=55513 RepID=UPI0012636949|nr:uncharacterized protein LOC116139276 [Pistacia vera]